MSVENVKSYAAVLKIKYIYIFTIYIYRSLAFTFALVFLSLNPLRSQSFNSKKSLIKMFYYKFNGKSLFIIKKYVNIKKIINN